MTKDRARDSGTINQDGAAEPTREERDRAFAGIAGHSKAKGEASSPDDRDRGETASSEDEAPIDLDAARDRAS